MFDAKIKYDEFPIKTPPESLPVRKARRKIAVISSPSSNHMFKDYAAQPNGQGNEIIVKQFPPLMKFGRQFFIFAGIPRQKNFLTGK